MRDGVPHVVDDREKCEGALPVIEDRLKGFPVLFNDCCQVVGLCVFQKTPSGANAVASRSLFAATLLKIFPFGCAFRLKPCGAREDLTDRVSECGLDLV